MTGVVAGILFGLFGSLGALTAIRYAPPRRRIQLADRIAPYLADDPRPSRLLSGIDGACRGHGARVTALAGIAGPVCKHAVNWLDRVAGGSSSVRRRLAAAGRTSAGQTVEEFRIEQVMWGASAMLLFAVVTALGGVLGASFDPLAVLVAAALGGIAGVVGRDRWLSRQVRSRERVLLAEFPVIADLLALSVLAGEAPVDAIARVCRQTSGELSAELRSAIDATRAGVPISTALSGVAERTSVDALARFAQGLVVAIERGTPLAELVRAQAADVREQSRRALLEAGGRKEVQMLVPVVFLILPVTVLFALFPGVSTLMTLAG
jgi:tight adherence protein C